MKKLKQRLGGCYNPYIALFWCIAIIILHCTNSKMLRIGRLRTGAVGKIDRNRRRYYAAGCPAILDACLLNSLACSVSAAI
jgi:hypothetical protein